MIQELQLGEYELFQTNLNSRVNPKERLKELELRSLSDKEREEILSRLANFKRN